MNAPHYQPDWENDELEPGVDPVLRQAVFWHEILNAPNPSADVRHEFEQWLRADDAHPRAYAGIDAIWHGAADFAQVHTKRGRMTRRAFMAGGIGLSGVVGYHAWRNVRPFADIRTAKGVRRNEILPDGSRIELAGQTALSLDYTATSRRIALYHGQAWFDMVPDASRPFDITVGNANIHGTQARFDVDMGNGETVLTMTDDRVTLRAGDAPPALVSAGQQVRTDGRRIAMSDADPSVASAWRSGRLEYVSQPMSRIIDAVNRWSKTEITIIGGGLARREATLIIDIDQIEHALDRLREAVPMRVITAPMGYIFIS